eukprot:CAMPEP_0117651408 /NCGR_PEP_ID=MMETSP0804-20121206/2076_1 /TAXON_ID=1074897 /ORGANISM="Tetraselmis astigmatica, Strain CCMP880" /LENGTH=574 /DNA_ID=CAMNT_0005457383 /DNA_START=1332 /DNA_END=3056 /DNA_ORIENTATION=-
MTVLTPAELQQQQQLQQRRHSFAADGQAVAQHRAPLSGAEDVAVPLQARAEIPLMASHLIEKARTHWLKGHELITLFQLSAEGKFPLSPMAAQLPPGGCIFLYDRRAVRFFRLDGHNWRKKNDGKTVKETHEKLKIDNEDRINCYYAHAVIPASMQRRCYWRLDDDSLVLVHYLEPNSQVARPWQPPPGLAQAAAEQAAGRFSMGTTAPAGPMAAAGAIQLGHGGLGGEKYIISQQKITMAAKNAAAGYTTQRNSQESVGLPWQVYGSQYTAAPFQWQSQSAPFASQPALGIPQPASWSWDTFTNAAPSHSDLGMHDSLAPVQEHASTSQGSQQIALPALRPAMSQAEPSRRPMAEFRRHSEEVTRRQTDPNMPVGEIIQHGSHLQHRSTGGELVSEERGKLADQSQGWFVIWEVSPEATSTEGGEKVLIVGHTTNGFEQNQNLMVDVDGQRCAAQVVKSGVLSFITPPHAMGRARVTVVSEDGRIMSAPSTLNYRGPPRRSIQTEFDPWGAARSQAPQAFGPPQPGVSMDAMLCDETPKETQMELIRFFLEKNNPGGAGGSESCSRKQPRHTS